MPIKRKPRRNNLQWKRVRPGTLNSAPNTLGSLAMVLPTDFVADDDYTFVKGFITVRVTAVGAVSGTHNILGACGIIKRQLTADSAQVDPILEDAQWMWWKPIILSSTATIGQASSFSHWDFELNAARMIQRFEGLTFFIKTLPTTTDNVISSVGGSLLFYKP